MRAIEKLNAVRLPEEGFYLWQWFLELHAGRGSGGFGPSAISYQDIKAWAELTGHAPTPWDIETIKQLDYAYLAQMATSAKQQAEKNKRNKGR